MKKIMPVIIKYSSVLASLALMIATISNQSACAFIYHQPKAPEGLSKLGK